jgi:phage baseplate assembly protein W
MTGDLSTNVLFPLRIGDRGRTATETESSAATTYLRGLVEQVLFTRPGERVNRPDFGTGLSALMFEPNGDELAGALQSLIRAALQDALATLASIDQVSVRAVESTVEVTVAFTPIDARGPEVVRVSNVAGGAR